jgi:Flp pilus assembly pilin Flp
MHRFRSDNRRSQAGAGLLEYALIISLVSVVGVAVVAAVGPAISNIYCEILITLGVTCDAGGEVDDEVDEILDVAIITSDYASGIQELHLDATYGGDYDPSVSMTASPGGVMEARAHWYHAHFVLTDCPCEVTVTSSEGNSASVWVGP